MSVSTFAPNLLTVPAPLMLPTYEAASERLNTKLAPEATAELPVIEPVVPASPTCKTPALTVMTPVDVLAPVSLTVLACCLVKVPTLCTPVKV